LIKYKTIQMFWFDFQGPSGFPGDPGPPGEPGPSVSTIIV